MVIVDQLILDTLDAIAALQREERYTQALILLYSAIDTLAWLDVTGETSRTAFKAWVDAYLIPGSSLSCTSEDLYSARCGLLHTHAAVSRGTSTGVARQIWYWTGQSSKQLLDHEAQGRTDVVLVRFSALATALVDGWTKFRVVLSGSATRWAQAQEKARKWLAWVPSPPVT